MSWRTCTDKKRKHQHGRACRGRKQCASRARARVDWWRTVHSAAGEHSTGGRLRSLPFWYERHASGCQRQRQPWAGAVSWSRRPDQHATPRQDRVSSSWPLGNARAPLTTARCFPAKANRGSKSERTLQRRGRGGIVIGETESKDQAGRLLAFAAAAVRSRARTSERATRSGCMRRAGSRSRIRSPGRQGVRTFPGGRAVSTLYHPYRKHIISRSFVRKVADFLF